jgi:hypothetical protein
MRRRWTTAARLALRRAGADPAPTGTVRIASGEWMARFLPAGRQSCGGAAGSAETGRRPAICEPVAARSGYRDTQSIDGCGALYVRQMKGMRMPFMARDYVERIPAPLATRRDCPG